MKLRAGLPLLLALALAALPARTFAQSLPAWLRGQLSVSTGVDYSSGDYGDPDDTEIWYVPFTLAYLLDDFAPTPLQSDQLELRVTVPFLHVSGPGGAVLDDGRPVSGTRPSARNQSSAGLGDILVRATWIWFPSAPGSPLPALELSGRVKAPTASEGDGLGTGEADYELQLDVYRRLWRLVPFATLGYRFAPGGGDLDLRDTLFASAGVGARLGERLSVGIVYDWRQGPSSRTSDAHELFPYATLRLGGGLELSPYGVVGLSSGSPDYGVGLQLRARIRLR